MEIVIDLLDFGRAASLATLLWTSVGLGWQVRKLARVHRRIAAAKLDLTLPSKHRAHALSDPLPASRAGRPPYTPMKLTSSSRGGDVTFQAARFETYDEARIREQFEALRAARRAQVAAQAWAEAKAEYRRQFDQMKSVQRRDIERSWEEALRVSRQLSKPSKRLPDEVETGKSLAELERRMERLRRAIDALDRTPPTAKPPLQSSIRLEVRHDDGSRQPLRTWGDVGNL